MLDLSRLLSRKHVRDKHISGDPFLSGRWVGMASEYRGPKSPAGQRSWEAFERSGRLVSKRSSFRDSPPPNGLALCPESAVAGLSPVR
jgi:hypothetical protein